MFNDLRALTSTRNESNVHTSTFHCGKSRTPAEY